MAQQHYRTHFKKALLQFITEPDPFLAMLKWVMTEMMRIEAEAKVGAVKGKHAQDRDDTYFSGASGPEGGYQAGNGLICSCPRSARAAISRFSSRRDADPNRP